MIAAGFFVLFDEDEDGGPGDDEDRGCSFTSTPAPDVEPEVRFDLLAEDNIELLPAADEDAPDGVVVARATDDVGGAAVVVFILEPVVIVPPPPD